MMVVNFTREQNGRYHSDTCISKMPDGTAFVPLEDVQDLLSRIMDEYFKGVDLTETIREAMKETMKRSPSHDRTMES